MNAEETRKKTVLGNKQLVELKLPDSSWLATNFQPSWLDVTSIVIAVSAQKQWHSKIHLSPLHSLTCELFLSSHLALFQVVHDTKYNFDPLNTKCVNKENEYARHIRISALGNVSH